LQTVRSYMDDRPLERRPVLAIGCDTEVAISSETVTNALMCLDFAREHNLPVQLATKFPLHGALRRTLDRWPYPESPPVIFTTITTIALSKRLEPNAPTPAERAANFRQHSPAWRSYALIKPFLAIPDRDRRDLVELLRTKRPDGVVVGIRYRRSSSNISGDAHPVASDWIATLPSGSARRLATQLTVTGLRVFMNTQCVTAWHNRSSDGQVVKEKFPHLCVGCGRCK
jgi:DNA repair photolyase